MRGSIGVQLSTLKILLPVAKRSVVRICGGEAEGTAAAPRPRVEPSESGTALRQESWQVHSPDGRTQ
jgi:hypothetical protein